MTAACHSEPKVSFAHEAQPLYFGELSYAPAKPTFIEGRQWTTTAPLGLSLLCNDRSLSLLSPCCKLQAFSGVTLRCCGKTTVVSRGVTGMYPADRDANARLIAEWVEKASLHPVDPFELVLEAQLVTASLEAFFKYHREKNLVQLHQAQRRESEKWERGKRGRASKS